jgi:hypothetical protein
LEEDKKINEKIVFSSREERKIRKTLSIFHISFFFLRFFPPSMGRDSKTPFDVIENCHNCAISEILGNNSKTRCDNYLWRIDNWFCERGDASAILTEIRKLQTESRDSPLELLLKWISREEFPIQRSDSRN